MGSWRKGLPFVQGSWGELWSPEFANYPLPRLPAPLTPSALESGVSGRWPETKARRNQITLVMA